MDQTAFIQAVEWVGAAAYLRSIFARQLEAHPGTVELRISVTLDALPGLAVIEYEVIGQGGEAVAGGAL